MSAYAEFRDSIMKTSVGGRAAVTFIGIFIILGWYLHQPVPDKVMGPDRQRIQLMSDVYRLAGIPTRFCGLLKSAHCLAKTIRAQTYLFLLYAGHPVIDEVSTEEAEIAGVPVRLYIPTHRESKGAIVYAHGGGWFIGSVELSHTEVLELAKRLQKIIISIEYRRAPENIFPDAVEDYEAVVRALLRHDYKRWDIDPDEIAVSGASSGGNLATVTAQRLRIKPEERSIKLQMLIYPILQMTNFQLPSYRQALWYRDTGMLSVDTMSELFLMYLNISVKYAPLLLRNAHIHPELLQRDEYKMVDERIISKQQWDHPLIRANETSPFFSFFSTSDIQEVQDSLKPYIFNPDLNPLHRSNLSGLPPVYMVACGYDPLRDEGFLYSQRLRDAGVPVTLQYYPEANHGVFSIFELKYGNDILNDYAKFARANLK